MDEPSRQKKHLILGLLTLACILIDGGFFLGLGVALKWLAEATSPFILAAFAAIVILAARVYWSMRLVSQCMPRPRILCCTARRSSD